jgi:DNA-binding transcriptional ArsR family regulator
MAEVLDRETLKALSTDTRQDILKMLAKRPYTASELSKILNKHVTTITEHLSVLEKSGVVRKKESTNKWVYYTLTDKGQKLFKPYYSWVLLFSLAVIVFVVGIYELTFVSYQATAVSMTEQAAQKAGEAPQAVQTAAIETSNLNLIIGILLLVIAVVLLWFAMRKRHKKIAVYNMNY